MRSRSRGRRSRIGQVKDGGDAARKAEIENFHQVLMDVSMGRASDRVREFIIRAYVKGMKSCDGTAEKCDFEGSTSVFTKRRFRCLYVF